ncbi:hypothetical protein KFL_003010145 [Klebsormidium nitens]|uniref:Uncharacterized protein n=1 Tax=Klebsormidium nitens TaxID=105231 RepID=A0A1Y1IB42_KLENI|nr:hypothetical protein KFL_003010145 [Klebsormidium nitens]|eukprot:GAQ86639.1 hypothetical protein KFL_003010145 [Klebsormidium nitens]
MADPDTYLEADLVAFSPKLGPGVSKEKPHAEETVAFTLNGLPGPPVQTLLQQHARFRTVTHSTIYYKQVMSSAVDLPRSTEAVFQAIERDNQQIVQMLGDASGFHYLRGARGICDCSSASSVLYANNILEKVESYLEYLTKLKADLESQGFVVTVEHIDPKGSPGRPLSEVPLGFDADPELLDDEDWRAKYIISSEQYEILCERPDNLTPREQLQEYLYELVMNEYKVDPHRVDHAFYLRFCDDSDDAKRTRDAHANYLRFREHRFAVLVGDLDTALEAAMLAGVVQEYVKQVQDPASRVPIAVRVLAFLLECGEEELDHELEQWEVSEERMQAAYAELIGPTKKRLKSMFNLYGFTQQTARPSKAADGRLNERWAQKRNAVAKVLRAGLGIEMQIAAGKSGGKFKTPHMLTPAIYRGLHERYGWLDAEIDAAESECTIRP